MEKEEGVGIRPKTFPLLLSLWYSDSVIILLCDITRTPSSGSYTRHPN